MGSSDKFRSMASQATAQANVREREQEREQAQTTVADILQHLGTPEQRAGQLVNVPADALKFYGQFTLDEAVTSGFLKHGKSKDIPDILKGNLGIANRILGEAKDAYEAGDFELAESLYQDALNARLDPRGRQKGWRPFADTSPIEAAFGFSTPTSLESASLLSTPSARTVGELVHQGEEFLDPESETSQRFKEALTEGGLDAIDASEQAALAQITAAEEVARRNLAAERRGAGRLIDDIGASQGAARNLTAEAHVAARTAERFGAERANIALEAGAARAEAVGEAGVARGELIAASDRYFEEFSRSFAANTVAFAQAWAEGQPGVNEQFQNAMDNLTTAAATFANEAATRFADFYKFDEALDAQQDENMMGLITSAVGLVLGAGTSLLTGGMSGLLMGGAGALGNLFGGGGGPLGGGGLTDPGQGDFYSILAQNTGFNPQY